MALCVKCDSYEVVVELLGAHGQVQLRTDRAQIQNDKPGTGKAHIE